MYCPIFGLSARHGVSHNWFGVQDMRKRKAGLEVKERHGQTCVPGALLVRVDTVQAALALVSVVTLHAPLTHPLSLCTGKPDSYVHAPAHSVHPSVHPSIVNPY